MSFEVLITKTAERDLLRAAEHIEFSLFDRNTADELISAADRIIGSLSELPERHGIADDPVLRSLNVRIAPVKNYLVFCTVSHEEGVVTVLRFLYGKRDWISILRGENSGDPE